MDIDEFDVFNEIDDTSDIEDIDEKVDTCLHNEIINDNGIVLCTDCGIEVTKIVSYEKDWRYYGSDDTRKNSDPNRCHIRKIEDKSIYKDVENFGFSEIIINTANDIYSEVTKGKIFRGNSRKAIIFGCIFHSVKLNKKFYSCDSLKTIFKLDKKIILKGIKYVNLNMPKNNILNQYITPIELVNEYILKFIYTEDDIKLISSIYEKIKNKSSLINRSRPQSIASSLIYYYFSKKLGSNNFSIRDFIKKIKLSELTINKITKEIVRLLEM